MELISDLSDGEDIPMAIAIIINYHEKALHYIPGHPLLTWTNMDKSLQTLWRVGWKYLSIHKLQPLAPVWHGTLNWAILFIFRYIPNYWKCINCHWNKK